MAERSDAQRFCSRAVSVLVEPKYRGTVELESVLKIGARLSSAKYLDIGKWVNACSTDQVEKALLVAIEEGSIELLYCIIKSIDGEKKGKALSSLLPKIFMVCSVKFVQHFTVSHSKVNPIDSEDKKKRLELARTLLRLVTFIMSRALHFKMDLMSYGLCFDMCQALLQNPDLAEDKVILIVAHRMMNAAVRNRTDFSGSHGANFLHMCHLMLKLHIKSFDAIFNSSKVVKRGEKLNATLLSEFLVDISENIARLFEEIGQLDNQETFGHHMVFFLCTIVGTIVRSSIPNKHRLILVKGMFCLLDICFPTQFHRVYGALNSDAEKVFFKKLTTDYFKLHKYSGNA
eukprot:TRINITY_DN9737_c0_g4_i1.p2 TRINITY_DN9737_c0_g4~~TRINITY_DN9737_c0_g4_i1.p2  ORF type:complete len:361 (+),score=104.95 TRINITY_DN9737_c0_g4_i1:50-1084(+)